MKFPRRRFLQIAAGAIPLPGIARAQAYPTRPVHIVVGFTPGGTTDIAARLIGQWLSNRFGQQFIVENRPGAGSNIAAEAVVNAPPDGYTLLLVGAPNAINATLYEKLNFNFLRDIAPVGGILRTALVMQINPSLPVKSIPEFIAFAKSNPGKINMSSAGNGSAPHVAGELFKLMAGIDMVHVPYRGAGPSLADLIGGQVQVTFESMPASIGHIRAGTLRALAVTTVNRSDALPDIPTVGEFVPGYEASIWYGVGIPKDTPTQIIDSLNKEINTGLANIALQARLADLGGIPLRSSPAEFGKLIADEVEKWARVVKSSGARPG